MPVSAGPACRAERPSGRNSSESNTSTKIGKRLHARERRVGEDASGAGLDEADDHAADERAGQRRQSADDRGGEPEEEEAAERAGREHAAASADEQRAERADGRARAPTRRPTRGRGARRRAAAMFGSWAAARTPRPKSVRRSSDREADRDDEGDDERQHLRRRHHDAGDAATPDRRSARPDRWGCRRLKRISAARITKSNRPTVATETATRGASPMRRTTTRSKPTPTAAANAIAERAPDDPRQAVLGDEEPRRGRDRACRSRPARSSGRGCRGRRAPCPPRTTRRCPRDQAEDKDLSH